MCQMRRSKTTAHIFRGHWLPVFFPSPVSVQATKSSCQSPWSSTEGPLLTMRTKGVVSLKTVGRSSSRPRDGSRMFHPSWSALALARSIQWLTRMATARVARLGSGNCIPGALPKTPKAPVKTHTRVVTTYSSAFVRRESHTYHLHLLIIRLMYIFVQSPCLPTSAGTQKHFWR